MAHDRPTKTGQYFEGTRYLGQAHYPQIADYVEQPLADLGAAKDFVAEHTAKGANVQVHEHKWTEQIIAYGWHPAAKRAAAV
jgi:hypothetical protein